MTTSELRRRWALVLPVGLFVLLVAIEWAYRHEGGWEAVLFTVRLASMQFLGLIFSVRAAFHPTLSSATQRVWRLIAVAFLLQLISTAGLAASAAEHGTTARVLLILGLIFRALFIPMLLAGLFALSNPPLNRSGRWKLTMDVLTVVGAGFMLLWYFVIGPTLVGLAGSAEPRFLVILYALGDLVLIVGLGVVLLRGTRPTSRGPVILLLVGSIAVLGSDLLLPAAAVRAPWIVFSHSTFWLNVVISLPSLFLAIAAVEQCRLADVSDKPSRPRPLSTPNWLPYLATAVGIGVMVVAATRSALYPWVGLLVGSVMITVGVAVRQIIALRENRHLAVTDPLTGLANRTQVTQSLVDAADRSLRTGTSLAVIQIDLVGFKQVNDAFGHSVGDEMLTTFADLLRRNTRDSDLAGRLGGDEFAVIISGVDAAEQAVATAERILAESGQPIPVGHRSMPMHSSIGIAVAGPQQEFLDLHPEQLLEQADVAMYIAKRNSGHGVHVYSGDPIEGRQLVGTVASVQLVYEPIVTLPGGEVVGVEAQVRGDGAFDAVDDVGWLALRRACAEVSAWQVVRPLDLAIRISPPLLASGAASEIQAALDRFGLAPQRLVIEVTERRLNPSQPVLEQLEAVRATGVRIALDGFGAGNASLRQVNQLPVTGVKLDQSFVDDIDGTPQGSAVARAVAHLADALDLETTAGGVTSAQQASELADIGYNRAQGPYFSPPLSASAMLTFLDTDLTRHDRRPTMN